MTQHSNEDLSDDAKLVQRAQQLPSTLEPSDQLWSRIATELQNEGPDATRTNWRPWALAAGLMLSLGVATMMMLTPDEPVPAVASTASADGNLIQVQLPQMRQQVLALLDEDFSDMPDEVRSTVMRNLQIIATARQEIEKALGLHPNDPLLRRLLIANYGNELSLLKSIETLTRQHQQRIQL